MTVDQHIAQAKHNYVFYTLISKLQQDNFYDWKVTILFYAALHLMRAYAQKHKLIPGKESHKDYGNVLDPSKNRKSKVPKHIWSLYSDLLTESITSRYNPTTAIDSNSKSLLTLNLRILHEKFEELNAWCISQGVGIEPWPITPGQIPSK